MPGSAPLLTRGPEWTALAEHCAKIKDVHLRTLFAGVPFHAALKEVLVARGVPIRPDVRPPLRPLTPQEREVALDAARRVGAL